MPGVRRVVVGSEWPLTMDMPLSRFYQSTMIFLFLIYPSVSTNVLRSLNCKDYGSDGRLLYADHRIDCGSATYRKIQIWSLVCIFVYPIGIPLFMYFSMVRAGISRVAKEKQNVARFAALLNLRKQQLSTMTRAAVSNAIGYPGAWARVVALHVRVFVVKYLCEEGVMRRCVPVC